jgi:ribosomal protein S12 methylthiotransferase
VNTCAFVRDAKEESIDAILEACALKTSGVCRAVIVAGCLPQRYREDLKAALREVDAFIGVDELERVGEIVRRLGSGETGIFHVSRHARRLFDPKPPRVLLTDGPYAYIKIGEGCSHHCGFCAIPMIRGRHRSRALNEIVREATDLLESGVRELVLISQDVTSYGRDLGNPGGLAELLRSLCGIGGKFWVRLLYGYPSRVTEDLIRAIGENPNVCKYLDIPVQHSHPAILRAMRRGEAAAAVASLPGRLREAIPGIVLRTTCLVGHPGETDEHFAHLLDYVREMEFDHLGVFAFSPEEDTLAFGMPDQVPQAVAVERRDRVMRVQQDIVRRKASALLGRTEEMLVERQSEKDKSVWVGRSGRYAPEADGEVLISGLPHGDQCGMFIPARYESRHGVYDMRAVAVSDRGPSCAGAPRSSDHLRG